MEEGKEATQTEMLLSKYQRQPGKERSLWDNPYLNLFNFINFFFFNSWRLLLYCFIESKYCHSR